MITIKRNHLFKTTIFIISVLAYSCSDDSSIPDTDAGTDTDIVLPATNGINGFVQKGPFVNGSNITIQSLDSVFNPTGNSFTITTIDDFGSFNLKSEIKSNYIETIAQGFYFNEVSGNISNSSLSLRAITDVHSELTTNINVLTTLSKNRIIYLINEEGSSFQEAKEKSEQEILAIFDIVYDASYDFNLMDIQKNGDEHAILLAISSILQGDLTVGELSELLSKIILDIEKDGILDSELIKDDIYKNALNLNLSSIRENLKNRYTDLGIDISIPEFEKFAKKLVKLEVLKTNPKNFELEVPFNLEVIEFYFNKAIDFDAVNENNIVITNAKDEILQGALNYKNEEFKIEFIPATELDPESKYYITLSKNLSTIDDDALSEDYIVEFNTVNIDIISNLLAYYPLNGNLMDESGNNKHGSFLNIEYGEDIKGNAGQSCVLLGEGSYLELPNVINMTESVWSYSIWFNLKELKEGVGPTLLGTRLSANAFWDIPAYISPSANNIKTYNETLAETSVNSISTNSWYHFVMVIDNGVFKMYINGELETTKNNFLSSQGNSGTTDFLGDAIGSFEYYTGKYYISERFRGEEFPTYMNGSVDNIRFYKRALNKFEVKKLYNEEN